MKNVFVLTGDYWHSAESIRPMANLVFNAENWNLVYTERPEDIYLLKDDPDLIVSFKDPIENDQIPTDVWCDDKWNEKLFELVKEKGTGLILAHAAVTDLPSDHPMIRDMIQSMFISHPEQCPMKFIQSVDHPVTDGVGYFTFPDFDEQYQMEMIEDSSVQILANAETVHGIQPAVWVSRLGKGNICCITPAHTTANLTCDGFIRLMKNAAEWCIGA